MCNYLNRMHPLIRAELQASPHPVEVRHSNRHLKIFVGPKLAGILPMDGFGHERGDGAKKMAAQIRRTIRSIPAGESHANH